MRYSEILRAVFTNINTNKFRVFLTALGIMVGALTIVLVVGIGQGSQAAVEDQFAKLNVGTIYVMSAPGTTSRYSLEPADLKAIREDAPLISSATLSVNGKSEVGYRLTSWSAAVAGVLDDYNALNNITMAAGEFIRTGDSENRNKTAVIGSDLFDILFEGEPASAIGEIVTLAGRKFEVIGVMNRLGDATQGVNLDESIVIPYETAIKYVTGSTVKPRITAIVTDVNKVPEGISQVEAILQTHYEEDSSTFTIKDAGSKLVAAQDSAKTMSLLLISVAAIVLVVGGIGIMNVLFVSVKERTREIGILKAIGAKRRDILLQFLFESIIISMAGGVIGLVLGILMLPLLSYMDVTALPSMNGNLLALAFATATGTFFGYYPALKASTLRPIDALRQE